MIPLHAKKVAISKNEYLRVGNLPWFPTPSVWTFVIKVIDAFQERCPSIMSLAFYREAVVYMSALSHQIKESSPKVLASASILESLGISYHQERVSGTGK